MTCPSCHRRFSTERNFDAHRSGAHQTGRHCRTETELRNIGLAPDSRGIWRREVAVKGATFPLRIDDLPKALPKGRFGRKRRVEVARRSP